MTTDFDGAAVAAGRRRSPSCSPATRSSERMLQTRSSRAGNVDFDTDVKPLLGERAAIARPRTSPTRRATSARASTRSRPARPRRRDDMRFVAVVDVADGKSQQVKDLLVREGAVPGGEHDGRRVLHPARTTTASSRSTTRRWSSRTRRSRSSPPSTPTQAGGDQTLAGTDKFTDALAKLPSDVFGQAYLDLGAFVQRPARPPGRRPSSSASPTTATPSWRRRSPRSPRAPA